MKHRIAVLLPAVVIAIGLGAACGGPATVRQDLPPITPTSGRSGGAATVTDASGDAFALPVPGLTREQRRAFAVGNSFFNDPWVVAPASAAGRDGLGPLFNATNCSGCHFRDGRGRPPAAVGDPLESLLVRLSAVTPAGEIPHPVYGEQWHDKAIPGIPREGSVTITYEEIHGTYADGTPYTLRRPTITLGDLGYGPLGEVRLSARSAPAVFGVGLLEALPDATLLALADPEDRNGDGIRGVARWVTEPRSGQQRVGRFGWNAGAATIEQQSAGAFAGDLGITSSLDPQDHATEAQIEARQAPHGGTPELSDHKLQRVVEYQRTLAVPARREADAPPVRRGEALFTAIGCAACHTPTLVTGTVPGLPALSGQTIHPYTDLLLHDLGEGLADHRAEGSATGRQWKTPPLWGLGLIPTVNGHDLLLHDGRARGPAEAILWHGGEAATSAEAFRRLPRDQREDLLAFLRSL